MSCILSCLGYSAATVCCVKCLSNINRDGIEKTTGKLFELKRKITDGNLIQTIGDTIEGAFQTLTANTSEYIYAKRFTARRAICMDPANTLSIRHSPSLKALECFSALAEYQAECYRNDWIEKMPEGRPSDLIKLKIPSCKIRFGTYSEITFRVFNFIILFFLDLARIVIGKTDFGLSKANYKQLGLMTDALDLFDQKVAAINRINRAIRLAQSAES